MCNRDYADKEGFITKRGPRGHNIRGYIIVSLIMAGIISGIISSCENDLRYTQNLYQESSKRPPISYNSEN